MQYSHTPVSTPPRFGILPFARSEIIAALAAVVWWILYQVFDIGSLFFVDPPTVRRLWFSRMMNVVFLFVLILFAVFSVRLLRYAFIKKNLLARRFLLYFAINFTILIILLLLVWPGMWSLDDVGILNLARISDFASWWHFFTGIVMILSAYLIPSSGGVEIVQTVMISGIIGYILAVFDCYWLDHSKRYYRVSVFLAQCAFLLPPVLLNDFCKYRNILCAYCEFLLIAQIFHAYKSHAAFWSMRTFLIVINAILVAAWRTENIYYPFFLFLFLLYIFGRSYWKKALLLSCFVLLSTVAIGRLNSIFIGSYNYSLTGMMRQAEALIHTAVQDPQQRSQAELEAIGKVMDLDMVLRAHSDDTLLKESFLAYTDAEYRDYVNAYIKLILRYPGTFIKERLDKFINVSGVNDEQINILSRTIEVFAPGTSYYIKDPTHSYYERYFRYPNDLPFSLPVRTAVIHFLGGMDKNGRYTVFFHIFWNLLPPLILSFVFLVVAAVKKQYFALLSLLTVFAKFPLIFLTSPACYFIYYFPLYLLGYIALFFFVSLALNQHVPVQKISADRKRS